jgi:hypothetical protein
MTHDERQEIYQAMASTAARAIARDEGRHEVADAIVGAAAAALVQLIGAKSACATLTRFATELRNLAGEEQKLGLDKRSDYALALATAARDPGNNRFRH